MLKHRGFPGRLPGTDFQFVIRRANLKRVGASPIIERKRFADRRPADRRADAGFMAALWAHFGEDPFERGNLDAGRLSWLFGREVVAAEDPLTRKAMTRCCASTWPWRRSVFRRSLPRAPRKSHRTTRTTTNDRFRNPFRTHRI